MLAIAVGPAETETFRMEFLRSLFARRLSGVRLVIFNAHIELMNAIPQVLSAAWQRCRVHFVRNALARVPRKQPQVVACMICLAFMIFPKEHWQQISSTRLVRALVNEQLKVLNPVPEHRTLSAEGTDKVA